MKPVSRAYEKLLYGLEHWELKAWLKDKVCADFGSSTGGFVQAILEQQPKKIYSIETSKNRLHFSLKEDEKVIVMDKTNALYVSLPEPCDFISIDVGWTPQRLVIPNAIKNLKPSSESKIVSLVKPHYESGSSLVGDEDIPEILEKVKQEVSEYVNVIDIIESPLTGKRAGNKEFLMLCNGFDQSQNIPV